MKIPIMKYDAGELYFNDPYHLLKAMRFMARNEELSFRVAEFYRKDGVPDASIVVSPKELLEGNYDLQTEIRYYKLALIYLVRYAGEEATEKEARYVADQLMERAMRWKGALFTKAEMKKVWEYLEDSGRVHEMTIGIYEGANEAYKERDWPRFRREVAASMDAWEKAKRQVAAWKGAKTRKAKAKSAA